MVENMQEKHGKSMPPPVSEEDTSVEFNRQCNQELSAFRAVDRDSMIQILQLLTPIDIHYLSRAGHFLFKYSTDEYSHILRAPRMDVTINSSLTVNVSYRYGKFMKQLNEYEISKNEPVVAQLKDNKIIHLRFINVNFSLDNSENIYIFIRRNFTKFEDVTFQSCLMKNIDKEDSEGAPPLKIYFRVLLDLLSPRIIRFHDSCNITGYNVLLDNSCLYNTERVFYSSTRLIVRWNNIHQFIAHTEPNNVVFEWRNPDLMPRKSWSIQEEKQNMLDWMEHNLDIAFLDIADEFIYIGSFVFPVECKPDIMKLYASIDLEWGLELVHIQKITYFLKA